MGPASLYRQLRMRYANWLIENTDRSVTEIAIEAGFADCAHFSRQFRATYGETPYAYLMTRRIERAKALLRGGELSVTEVCMAVGCTSLGSFSSTFTRLVGEPPSAYKARDHSRLAPVPPCLTRAWARPGWTVQPCRIGEAFLAGRA